VEDLTAEEQLAAEDRRWGIWGDDDWIIVDYYWIIMIGII
jgi:hypothetical protein